jgi:hypothetical protein
VFPSIPVNFVEFNVQDSGAGEKNCPNRGD